MGGSTLVRIDSSGDIIWTFADHLGSPTVATDASGAMLWREVLTPYGEPWTHAPANDNHPAFTGHVRDQNTGLTYMQARYYDPVIGRFLSSDPVGFQEAGWQYVNRYWYTAGDPVNAVDPTGQEGERYDADPYPIPIQLEIGREAHSLFAEAVAESGSEWVGGISRMPDGHRVDGFPDATKWTTRKMYELKPNSHNSIKAGNRQLTRYEGGRYRGLGSGNYDYTGYKRGDVDPRDIGLRLPDQMVGELGTYYFSYSGIGLILYTFRPNPDTYARIEQATSGKRWAWLLISTLTRGKVRQPVGALQR